MPRTVSLVIDLKPSTYQALLEARELFPQSCGMTDQEFICFLVQTSSSMMTIIKSNNHKIQTLEHDLFKCQRDSKDHELRSIMKKYLSLQKQIIDSL